MQASAGTDSYNLWQWAWFWQRSLTFTGAPAGFGVLGSIDNTPGLIGKIIAAGGAMGLRLFLHNKGCCIIARRPRNKSSTPPGGTDVPSVRRGKRVGRAN